MNVKIHTYRQNTDNIYTGFKFCVKKNQNTRVHL